MSGRDRVGVLVVAYNAASTLSEVLDRLPPAFRSTVDHVLVCDDASTDATHQVGLHYQATRDLPLTVVRHPRNRGYGGNQKAGYRWAIDHGLDVVVLLHGDGQYAPEVIEELVEPLGRGEADAVFGSRMMTPGAARAGGMPPYKYVGNRILTTIQNALTGLGLSEWHSGYRAYRVDALADIPFESYSDGFDFDTEIILGLHAADKRIAEVPIPTYYGDEICYVNGVRYAKDVTMDVLRYRLQRIGFGRGSATNEPYPIKASPHSSHGVLLRWVWQRPPGQILDVGCSDGAFGARFRAAGHRVVGVDLVKQGDVADHLDEFVEADVADGVPDELGDFDLVIGADVLEHVPDPASLLRSMSRRLKPEGSVLISVPNFAHWYPRLRVVSGRFGYDQRGLLDRGHLRFFTRRTLEQMIDECGLEIVRRAVVGSPLEVATRESGSAAEPIVRAAEAVDRLATRLWPTLFGYQFLYELRPRR